MQNIPTVDESIVTDVGTIEEVTEFTHLGDVISYGGDSEASVRHRIAKPGKNGDSSAVF